MKIGNCPWCNGLGKEISAMFDYYEICSACNGTGYCVHCSIDGGMGSKVPVGCWQCDESKSIGE